MILISLDREDQRESNDVIYISGDTLNYKIGTKITISKIYKRRNLSCFSCPHNPRKINCMASYWYGSSLRGYDAMRDPHC